MSGSSPPTCVPIEHDAQVTQAYRLLLQSRALHEAQSQLNGNAAAGPCTMHRVTTHNAIQWCSLQMTDDQIVA